MDIDFNNLTDDMKAEITANMGNIEKATGLISFDPEKPLPRSAQEQLKITPKVDGKEVELTVWDAAQNTSLARAAAKSQRDNAKNAKVVAALESFRGITSKADIPTDDTLDLVAEYIGTTKEAILSSFDVHASEGDDDKQGDKKVDNTDATADAKAFNEAVAAEVAKQLKPYENRMFSSEYHKGYNDDRVSVASRKLLDEKLNEAIEADPKLTQLRKDAGKDKQKLGVLTELTKLYKSTATAKATGRIDTIVSQGKGDIEEEIPGIVSDSVALIDPTELLTMINPQSINFGGTESTQAIEILSTDADQETPDFGTPAYDLHIAKLMGAKIAEASAV